MRKLFLIPFLLLIPILTFAQGTVTGSGKLTGSGSILVSTGGSGPIQSFGVGWTPLSNATTLQGNGRDQCPPNGFGGSGYSFDAKCVGVFAAWTSFAWDPAGPNGPRMLSFSNGGHSDYHGNEGYEFNPRTNSTTRLNNPSTAFPAATCTGEGTQPPMAGHTYGFNTVAENTNKLYVWARIGYDTSDNGCATFKMFALDLTTVNQTCAPTCSASWSPVTPTGLPTTETIVMADGVYNHADGKIYTFESFDAGEQGSFSVFDPIANTWTNLNKVASNTTLYMTLGIDEAKQVAVVMGTTTDSPNPGGVYWMDISSGSTHTIHHPAVDSSCTALTNPANPPSFWYDQGNQELMAIANGTFQNIYIINVDTVGGGVTCTQEVYGSTEGTDFPEHFNFDDGDTSPMFSKIFYNASDQNAMVCANIDKRCWILKRSPVIRATNTSGSTITNTPCCNGAQTFAQGDIPNFPQARINGSLVTTQADVKTRWPDGSVQQAIVSFIIPSLAASTTQKVYLVNQATGNNTGFLAKSDILGAGFNFDASISETGTANHVISARAILTACSSIADPGTDPSSGANGNCRYWTKGSIMTSVIFEDRSAARSLDFNSDGGSANPLHPYFECQFWSVNSTYDCIYAVEDDWASSTTSLSAKDQTYAFTLTTGNTSPTTIFTQTSFNQLGRSRWVKDFCGNGSGVGTSMLGCFPIDVDHNMPYMAYSRVIPNFDPTIIIPQAELTGYSAGWTSGCQAIQGCTGPVVGQIGPDLDTGGTSPWWGRINTWDIMNLFSHTGACPVTTCSIPAMKQTIGNGQLVGRLPFHYREADTVNHFDNAGAVATGGRIFSVNARPQESIGIGPGNDGNPGNGFNDPCGGSNTLVYNFGTMTTDGWNTDGMDPSHWPQIGLVPYLLTGKFYYLEETQLAGAYMVGWGGGCPGARRDGAQGVLFQSQFRGEAWSIRSALDAYIVSPDSSPEKAYFLDKLSNTAIAFEGTQGIGNTDSTRTTAYNFGVANVDPNGVSPLHFYAPGFSQPDMSAFVESPLNTSDSITGAWSPWEENYNFNVYASARDIGLPGWTNLLSFAANRAFHAALDTTAGSTGPYMAGTYRYPTKISNNWVTSYTQYATAFTGGNGSGIANAWVPSGCVSGSETACAQQKPCFYSPEDDHWKASAMAELGFLYPYTADGFNGRVAYDTVRVSLYSSSGCMPKMFNGFTLSNLANPKWDIVPRR